MSDFSRYYPTDSEADVSEYCPTQERRGRGRGARQPRGPRGGRDNRRAANRPAPYPQPHVRELSASLVPNKPRADVIARAWYTMNGFLDWKFLGIKK
jgi:hypothetical protein